MSEELKGFVLFKPEETHYLRANSDYVSINNNQCRLHVDIMRENKPLFVEIYYKDFEVIFKFLQKQTASSYYVSTHDRNKTGIIGLSKFFNVFQNGKFKKKRIFVRYKKIDGAIVLDFQKGLIEF